MKSHLQNLIQINGAISISQFMNEALFHPQFGYYKTQNPFGRDGDFITAPEISQVFGELIGAYLVNIWQNNYSSSKINLVEMGAGRGTLMKDLLNVAKKIPRFLENVNISIIEISPKLKEIQKKNLPEFKISWYENFADFFRQKNDVPIFFIANELFDCFAIDQFVKTKNGWAEKMVGVDKNGELQFVLSPKISLIKIKEEVAIDSILEHSHQAINFMNELSQAIKKTNGLALIIDYGYINNELKNTLQAVKNNQYSNVLKDVGDSDITALVDFSALKNIAIKNNLKTSIITQREFLNSLGIELRRKKLLAGKNIIEQEKINSSINRLVDLRQMGELFKFLVIWS
jgi:SAM-dependent MidA family methyltransferase